MFFVCILKLTIASTPQVHGESRLIRRKSFLVLAWAWQVDECHMLTFLGFLNYVLVWLIMFHSIHHHRPHLSAMTVISSPVLLMVQL